MNANNFAASLKNGYGQPVPSEMLDALGFDRAEHCERPLQMPQPIVVDAGWRLARNPGRAANANLRLVG